MKEAPEMERGKLIFSLDAKRAQGRHLSLTTHRGASLSVFIGGKTPFPIPEDEPMTNVELINWYILRYKALGLEVQVLENESFRNDADNQAAGSTADDSGASAALSGEEGSGSTEGADGTTGEGTDGDDDPAGTDKEGSKDADPSALSAVGATLEGDGTNVDADKEVKEEGTPDETTKIEGAAAVNETGAVDETASIAKDGEENPDADVAITAPQEIVDLLAKSHNLIGMDALREIVKDHSIEFTGKSKEDHIKAIKEHFKLEG
jgi:hypothetical protein